MAPSFFIRDDRVHDIGHASVPAVALVNFVYCDLGGKTIINELLYQIPDVPSAVVLLLYPKIAICPLLLCELFRGFVSVQSNLVLLPQLQE